MSESTKKALSNWLIFLVLAMMIMVPASEKVSAAGNANLVLLPASRTVGVTNSFDVAVQVHANADLINVVQFYLDFDTVYLYVNSITPASAWNGNQVVVLENTFDNVAGRVNFSGGILGDTVKGDIAVATVNFIARKATPNTSITFHFTPPPSRETNVYGLVGAGTGSVLGTATGASLVITGAGGSTSQSPQLVSIAVTPSNPPIVAGRTQQFVATGTYSDKSSADITNQVTWKSSNQAAATIATTGKTSSGLLTGLAAGATTISASLGAISTSVTLTVIKAEDKPVASPTEPKAEPTTPSTPSTSPSPGALPGVASPTGEPKTTIAPPTVPTPVPLMPGVPQELPAATTAIIDWRLIGGVVVVLVILLLVWYLFPRRRV